MRKLICTILLFFISIAALPQSVDENQLGAWYMYFVNKKFENSRFGIQGDYQFRFWDIASDLEQILLRTGVTYTPKNASIMFTLGYANITTGTFGESNDTFNENRMYQEALFGQKIGSRFLLTHRFRYEQRWVQGQDFRTRYRYNIFVNIPLNSQELKKNTIYIALYNEIFINGERNIGNDRTVEFFDRNRTYTGLGYNLLDNLRLQAGWMKQTTVNWSKGQLQFSLHHQF
ncbi:DUF2490 domain-containing protein [Persicobacter diffluens]|uniref:DUF2490 domain-containing protein n=1 Tax=Persicobacter diffluens TaxID=981 RepID=A0AAN5AQ63_9BACT|nr:hypothetical protein PEDI_50950 [Persicobacter diffluens]